MNPPYKSTVGEYMYGTLYAPMPLPQTYVEMYLHTPHQIPTHIRLVLHGSEDRALAGRGFRIGPA